MSANATDPGHGDTPAAWTAVICLMLAAAVGTLAIWLDNNSGLLAVAGVLAVVGLAAGYVLARLGYGKNGSKLKSKH
ncbi:MAG: DUF6704 family protein [Micrococcales bacterium]